MNAILAQTVTLDLGSIAGMAAIAVAAVTITQFALKIITNWVNSQKLKKETEGSFNEMRSTLPTDVSPMPCFMSHAEMKQSMSSSFKETNDSLNRLAAGLDSFRDMVQRSHENILVNQREIVIELRQLKS